MALGLGLLFWITALFSPLAMVQPAMAQGDDIGTVIGIVSGQIFCTRILDMDCTNSTFRIWAPHTPASV